MDAQRELTREVWGEYFDAVSRELLNAEVSIEVADGTGPLMLEAEHLALHALTYDRRGDVFEVAAARGGPHLPSVLRHLIDRPARVAVDSQTMLPPMSIIVDDREGVRTVITIKRDPEITG